MRTIHKAEEFPAGAGTQLCVVEFCAVTVPGRESSHNPGAYTPTDTENYTRFHVFTNVDELHAWLALRQRPFDNVQYMVIKADRVPVRTTIQVELD